MSSKDGPLSASSARAFCDLFPAVYLRFHRRDGKARELPAASRAVLQHLSVAGPLRIGELARHLDRAQSVVSEIVSHLEKDGLLERFRDTRDGRVALTWLTEQGLALLANDREVLAVDQVERAMSHMRPADRHALLRGMQALLEADSLPATTRSRPKVSKLSKKRKDEP